MWVGLFVPRRSGVFATWKSVVSCVQGGMYWLQLMDAYCMSYILLVVGIVESIVLCWVYGEFFCNNEKDQANSKDNGTARVF